MKNKKWKKYAFEFLSIFVAIILAFALSNWNDNRKDNLAESKILVEILNGLEKDIVDVKVNVGGHKTGINSAQFWRNIINNQPQNIDSVQQKYLSLTRDFISIQNISGYETLKSRGFELIKNDELRSKIISLYEYDYQTLMKLEEEYNELQFQENYFKEINKLIAPHFNFDLKGNIGGIELPLNLADSECKLLLSYLWKIQTNRAFILKVYSQTEKNIAELIVQIKKELKR